MALKRQFDFGKNWGDFSVNALTEERVRQAREDFSGFMARGPGSILGRSFLDIGFGQGLSLLCAAAEGAKAVGCDINPKCAQVLESNRSHFPEVGNGSIAAVVGSILDSATVDALRALSSDDRGYEIVHSWGVLHHTGSMWKAIDNAVSLVRPGGTLFLALYNKHWTSPAWTAIKYCYVNSPGWLQKVAVAILYPVIVLAKWIVTRRNPMRMDRGMDFYYNVVDWVGGYPYEYASVEEIERYLIGQKCVLRSFSPSVVPTGCNEFVFVKQE